MFKRITVPQRPLRLALDGPSGSGKTYTALRIAFAIAGRTGRVAVIDTEAGSASLYVGQAPDEIPWIWDGVSLEYHAPSSYQTVIEEAGRQGYNVLVIDSLSHAWMGTGGALAQVDSAAPKAAGGSYGAWREVTPAHDSMVRAMMTSPCHVIVTLRTKVEYALESENGKTVVKKLGTKSIQREGVEYEFDVVGDLDLQHRLTVSKTRYPSLDGKIVMRPGPDFIRPVLEWLARGGPTPAPAPTVQPVAGPVESPAPAPTPPPAPPVVVLGERCDPELACEIVNVTQTLGWPPEKLGVVLNQNGFESLEVVPRARALELRAALQQMLLEKEGEKAF